MSARYFSVKYAVKILGIRYIPVVCYRLDSTIEPTILAMADTGEARLYEEKVRFVNGMAYPAANKKLERAEKPAEPDVMDVKPGKKKGGRAFE
jgi:hypothetical protein